MGRVSREEPDAHHNGPRARRDRRPEAELPQYRPRCRRDVFAAHLAPRKPRLFRDGDGPARPRQRDRRRRARGPAADDEGVDAIHGRRDATKRWLKGARGISRSVHPSPAGHSEEISASANPARTLTTASWRLTSLHPIT